MVVHGYVETVPIRLARETWEPNPGPVPEGGGKRQLLGKERSYVERRARKKYVNIARKNIDQLLIDVEGGVHGQVRTGPVDAVPLTLTREEIAVDVQPGTRRWR